MSEIPRPVHPGKAKRPSASVETAHPTHQPIPTRAPAIGAFVSASVTRPVIVRPRMRATRVVAWPDGAEAVQWLDRGRVPYLEPGSL